MIALNDPRARAAFAFDDSDSVACSSYPIGQALSYSGSPLAPGLCWCQYRVRISLFSIFP